MRWLWLICCLLIAMAPTALVADTSDGGDEGYGCGGSPGGPHVCIRLTPPGTWSGTKLLKAELGRGTGGVCNLGWVGGLGTVGYDPTGLELTSLHPTPGTFDCLSLGGVGQIAPWTYAWVVDSTKYHNGQWKIDCRASTTICLCGTNGGGPTYLPVEGSATITATFNNLVLTGLDSHVLTWDPEVPGTTGRTIPVTISDGGSMAGTHVTVDIYNWSYNWAGGRICVRTIEQDINGSGSVIWDGNDNSGDEVEAGVYAYTLRVSHLDDGLEPGLGGWNTPVPVPDAITDEDSRTANSTINPIQVKLLKITDPTAPTGSIPFDLSYTYSSSRDSLASAKVTVYDPDLTQVMEKTLSETVKDPTTGETIEHSTRLDVVPTHPGDYTFVVSAREGDKDNKSHSSKPLLEVGTTVHHIGELVLTQKAKGTFLEGIDFSNEFTGTMAGWRSGTGKIRFSIVKDGVELSGPGLDPQELSFTGSGVTGSFNMGKLPSGPCITDSVLRVTIKSKGKLIAKKELTLESIQPKNWMFMLTRSVTPVVDSGYIRYDGADFTLQNLSSSLSMPNGVVWDKVGGKWCNFTVKKQVFCGKTREYTCSVQGKLDIDPPTDKVKLLFLRKGDSRPDLKNSYFQPTQSGFDLGLEVRSTADSGCFTAATACVSGGAYADHTFRRGPFWLDGWIPIYLILKISLEADLTVCIDLNAAAGGIGAGQSTDLASWISSAQCPITAQVDGRIAAGLPGYASLFAGGALTVEFTPGIKCPPPTCLNQSWLCDAKGSFEIYVGGELYKLSRQWTLASIECDCNDMPCKIGFLGSKSELASVPHASTAEPYSSCAATGGYPAGGVQASGSSDGPRVASTRPGHDFDRYWVTNVEPMTRPAMAASGNKFVLALSEPIPGASSPTSIIYAAVGEGGMWGERVPVSVEGVVGTAPVAGVDANGKRVIAWVTAPTAAANDTWAVLKPKLEIAYSVYNDATELWSSPSLLTSNTAIDFYPSMSTDTSGNLSLVWLRSPDNSLTTLLDSTQGTGDVVVATWNGTGFSTPQTLLTGIGALGGVCYAKGGDGSEYIAWTQDADGDASTAGDLEVVEQHRASGGAWSSVGQLCAPGVCQTAGLLPGLSGATVYYVAHGVEDATGNIPLDAMLARSFSSGAWSSEELQFESDLITNPQFSADSDGIACVWGGVTDTGRRLCYTIKPNGSDWHGPQNLCQGDEYDASLAKRGSQLAVLHMLTYKSNVDGSAIYDVGYLTHVSYSDLTIDTSDITCTPSKPTGGQTVQVDLNVHLAGDVDQPGVVVALYDGYPDEGVTPFSTGTLDMVAGTSQTYTGTWTYPNDGQAHTVYATVELSTGSGDENPSNNEAVRAIGEFNLVAGKPYLYQDPSGQVSIRATVENTGDSPVPNAIWELREGDAAGPFLTDWFIPTIAAHSSTTVEYVIDDVDSIATDSYSVALVVDPDNRIEETDETDNVAISDLSILPDLAIDESTKQMWSDSSETWVSFTVTNIGTRPSPATVANTPSDYLLTDIPALLPGESTKVTVQLPYYYDGDTAQVEVNPATYDWVNYVEIVPFPEVTRDNNKAIFSSSWTQ